MTTRFAIPTAAAAAILAFLLGGCSQPALTFPLAPAESAAGRSAYDTDGDGVVDFFTMAGPAGRIDRIAYDDDKDGEPDRLIHLDAIPATQVRHLVIVLDGMPYDIVAEQYEAGRLRLFGPPAVLIPPYPAMTDLALQDAFGDMPALGQEAKYFNPRKNRVVGGVAAYMKGINDPFTRLIEYRASTVSDAFAYLWPEPEFRKELKEVKELWDRRETKEVIAYFAATAAMGTRKGREGHLQTLREIERLAMQMLHESSGLVKVTLMADHGQTNVATEPAGLNEYLAGRGYRLSDTLQSPEDVVTISFGLITCAAISTRSPARVAADLAAWERSDVVSYADGDAVVVLVGDEKARIHNTDGRTFRYERIHGDPLGLGELVGEGPIDGRELLAATVEARHEYPDALQRLWRTHFALTENAPDVMLSFKDRYYHGAGGFSSLVDMASTHGGLNWGNSATLLMSSAGKVQGPLRSEDIPEAMRKLFDRPWPALK
jgi:hypothetical protein